MNNSKLTVGRLVNMSKIDFEFLGFEKVDFNDKHGYFYYSLKLNSEYFLMTNNRLCVDSDGFITIIDINSKGTDTLSEQEFITNEYNIEDLAVNKYLDIMDYFRNQKVLI